MSPTLPVVVVHPPDSAGPDHPKPTPRLPFMFSDSPSDNPDSQTAVPVASQPPPRPSILSRLALPLAILIGAAITACTTYPLVKHVQHLIANASVSSSPQTWTSAARSQVYDTCYHGCAGPDCPTDPGFFWTACQRTVSLPGGDLCDATKIWNWADRYPPSCLAAMGDILRAEALHKKKRGYRCQLALIVLTVLAGVVGGVVTRRLLIRWGEKRDSKKAAARRANLPSGYRSSTPSSKGGRLKVLLAAFLSLFPRTAQAFPCIGGGPSASQYFASPNGTVRGVVQGWWSDCYRDSKGHHWLIRDRKPSWYVADASRRVERCGFQLVRQVDDAGVIDYVRVANGLIEKELRVSVRVNGYNVTRPDEMVLCLHDIAGS